MRRVHPCGDRIMVKRRIIGDTIGKAGIIVTAEETKERTTDIVDVLYVPDKHSAMQVLVASAESIIKALEKRLHETGDPKCVESLLTMNEIQEKESVKVGDTLFIGKYNGIDFEDSDNEKATLVNVKDIICKVKQVGDE